MKTGKTRMIEWESIPAWYKLGFANSSLSITIHRNALELIGRHCSSQKEYVHFLQKTYNVDGFVDLSGDGYGFGGILKQVKDDGVWTRFECLLPVQYQYDKAEASNQTVNTRVTLHMIFNSLWLFPSHEDVVDTDATSPQLIVIDSICLDVGHGGAALGAILTPAMCQWLSNMEDHSHITEVVEAMRNAYYHMWPNKERSLYDRFGARFRKPKWLNLDIPGDACNLDPDSYNDLSLERGYTLVPHNMDSSAQQLAFLAGLGALCDLAHKQSV